MQQETVMQTKGRACKICDRVFPLEEFLLRDNLNVWWLYGFMCNECQGKYKEAVRRVNTGEENVVFDEVLTDDDAVVVKE